MHPGHPPEADAGLAAAVSAVYTLGVHDEQMRRAGELNHGAIRH